MAYITLGNPILKIVFHLRTCQCLVVVVWERVWPPACVCSGTEPWRVVYPALRYESLENHCKQQQSLQKEVAVYIRQLKHCTHISLFPFLPLFPYPLLSFLFLSLSNYFASPKHRKQWRRWRPAPRKPKNEAKKKREPPWGPVQLLNWLKYVSALLLRSWNIILFFSLFSSFTFLSYALGLSCGTNIELCCVQYCFVWLYNCTPALKMGLLVFLRCFWNYVYNIEYVCVI